MPQKWSSLIIDCIYVNDWAFLWICL